MCADKKISNRFKCFCKIDLVFALVIILCGSFLVWKAHQGYIFNDEPFMVSIAHRLLKGDRLFVHEWNTTQVNGLFYVPWVFLFTKIKGSTEGLILFCRIIYVIWWLFVGVILYKRLRQFGGVSVVATVFFLLYTPLDEMTLTYNALGLSFLLVFVTYFLSEGTKCLDYLNGVVLALAVLAYPGFVVVYFIFVIAVVVKTVLKIESNKKILRMLSWKVLLRITIAAGIIALIFCGYVLLAGFDNVYNSIVIAFLNNSNNKNDMIQLIRQLYKKMPFMIIGSPLCIIVSLIDRNRIKRLFLYLFFQVIVFIITLFYLLHETYLFNTIMIPLFAVGLQAFVLIKGKNMIVVFSLGAVGLIASFCWYFSSDTGLLAFSNGFIISNIASFIYISQLNEELYKDSYKTPLIRVATILIIFTMGVQIGAEVYIRTIRSYWDELFPKLNTEICVGVAEGVKTTSKMAESYNKVYGDIQEIKRLTQNDTTLRFLSLSLFPSIYLDLGYEYGTFSTWTFTGNAEDFTTLNKKLKQYYELNPEKVADIIYISYQDKDKMIEIDSIDKNEYEETELHSGCIFIKKKRN